MNDSLIKGFLEKVEIESSYKKIVDKNIIWSLIDAFNLDVVKEDYSNNINNCLELSLQFYKDYNKKYYNIILDGINNKKIIISTQNEKSFVNTQGNNAYIKLIGNDSDIFMLVHEFAHYIDRNSNPVIVPNEYWFLSETFSIYIEKKLEQWLGDKKYYDLIAMRINNRMFYEKKMMNAIITELFYEDIYIDQGEVLKSNVNIDDVKLLNQYNMQNTINYLLQYPLANIISNYLVEENMYDGSNFTKTCLDIDLYKAIEKFTKNNKYKK